MRCIAALCLLILPLFLLAAELRYPDKMKLLIVKDASGKESPITTTDTWKTRRSHILEAAQEVMGPLPKSDPTLPFDAMLKEDLRTEKFIRLKGTILVGKDDRLPIYLFKPLKINGKVPGIVCLHPTSKEFGKGIAAGLSGKSDRHYAVHLAELGYVTIAPDYVNMGEYQFDAYNQGYISATMKGIVNHIRCVDYLQSLPDVDGTKIGAIGHSLGGHNAIFLGVFDERVGCIISSCGFCSFAKYMKGDLAGWSHNGYMPLIKSVYETKPQKMPFDFTELVGCLAPRPFLACAPLNDNNFDPDGVKDCIIAAKPVYELFKVGNKLRAIYPESGHDFPDDARKEAYQWFETWLRGK